MHAFGRKSYDGQLILLSAWRAYRVARIHKSKCDVVGALWGSGVCQNSVFKLVSGLVTNNNSSEFACLAFKPVVIGVLYREMRPFLIYETTKFQKLNDRIIP